MFNFRCINGSLATLTTRWFNVHCLSSFSLFLGFGFCEYADPDSTLRALRLLDKLKLGEKALVVRTELSYHWRASSDRCVFFLSYCRLKLMPRPGRSYWSICWCGNTTRRVKLWARQRWVGGGTVWSTLHALRGLGGEGGQPIRGRQRHGNCSSHCWSSRRVEGEITCIGDWLRPAMFVPLMGCIMGTVSGGATYMWSGKRRKK